MKSEADPRRRPVFCVILKNIVNLEQKVRIGDWLGVMIFFFRDHHISRKKSALPGTIWRPFLFFFFWRSLHFRDEKCALPEMICRDHCFLRTKSAYLEQFGDLFCFFFFLEITAFSGRKVCITRNDLWRSLFLEDEKWNITWNNLRR